MACSSTWTPMSRRSRRKPSASTSSSRDSQSSAARRANRPKMFLRVFGHSRARVMRREPPARIARRRKSSLDEEKENVVNHRLHFTRHAPPHRAWFRASVRHALASAERPHVAGRRRARRLRAGAHRRHEEDSSTQWTRRVHRAVDQCARERNFRGRDGGWVVHARCGRDDAREDRRTGVRGVRVHATVPRQRRRDDGFDPHARRRGADGANHERWTRSRGAHAFEGPDRDDRVDGRQRHE
mmetsp:Transcript_1972/g.7693  ORF Transcript_1972/g.7693 Transcript_1972/m.7693 type:complete len:241 (+) Transcript_1972:1125-1847(+)